MHGTIEGRKLHVTGGSRGLLTQGWAHADTGSNKCCCPRQAEIEEALASGEWRAERTPGPQAAALGTSCPRF